MNDRFGLPVVFALAIAAMNAKDTGQTKDLFSDHALRPGSLAPLAERLAQDYPRALRPDDGTAHQQTAQWGNCGRPGWRNC
jgi:hypothetical protein